MVVSAHSPVLGKHLTVLSHLLRVPDWPPCSHTQHGHLTNTQTPHTCAPAALLYLEECNCTVAVVTVTAPHSGGLAPSPQPLPQIVREFALPPGGRCPPESLLTGLPYTSPNPLPSLQHKAAFSFEGSICCLAPSELIACRPASPIRLELLHKAFSKLRD